MDTEAFGISTSQRLSGRDLNHMQDYTVVPRPVVHRHREAAVLRLRILGTTDLHGFLRGYDYAADRPSLETGLSRIATLIRQARAEVANTLLFDNGDFLQGTQLVDYWARGRAFGEADIHPMIAAMNALCYDAGTLGNHEFDFGLSYLERALRDATFPIVSTNLTGASHAPAPVCTSALLERVFQDEAGQDHRVRIGVIGLLPPQTAWINQSGSMRPIDARDMIEAARDTVPRLREAGADLVVALAHTGIEPALPGAASQSENTATSIATVPGIDALLCGHSHLSFPDPTSLDLSGAGLDRASGTIEDKPAVMPGRWGSHLGVIDLTLSRIGDSKWQVRAARGSLRPVARRIGPRRILSLATEDPEITALSAPAHLELMGQLSHPIGASDRPLQSFFSLVAPDAVLDLIADAQRDYIAHKLAGLPEANLPLLSAVSPGKTGGRGGPSFFIDIAQGPITLRHVLGLYGYPNLASAIRLTGREISDWLEYGASTFNRIGPQETNAPLLNPEFPGYSFDVLTGLRYEIDLSLPPRFAHDGTLANPTSRRLRNLSYRGRPVTDDQSFVVATNNFRSSGMGPFPRPSEGVLDLGETSDIRRILIRAIEKRGEIRPRAKRHWQFAPQPGSSAWFDTSPLASGRLSEADACLEEMSLSPQGFLRVRLHL